MTNVPPVLDPWLPWLRGHSPDTERVLGPWLRTLAAAVGPVAERREPDPAGEPTGWSGLANRGPYDRLLISEWMLAEELPDEFLRRATAGEHLFVELDRNRPHRTPWTVLLCDTGPEQLGGPRLLHLALLVVLASRRDAPERLAVGSLQGTELLEPALAASTGRSLAQAHTRRPPTRADVARWTEALRREGDGEPPELWIAGGRDATSLPYGRANRVVVEEDWRNGELLVAVHRTDGAVARVELPAPPAGSGKILHDPFAVRRDPLPVGAEEISATYARSRWLFLRTRRAGQDALEALASPKVTRKSTKRVAWQIRRDERLLAAARISRRAVSLWLDGDELVLDGLGPEVRLPQPAAFRVDSSAPLEPMHGVGRRVVVADGGGQVWDLDFHLQRGVPLAPRVGPSWFLADAVLWSDGDELHRWARGSHVTLGRTPIGPVSPLVRWQALGLVGEDLVRVDVSWSGAGIGESRLHVFARRARFPASFPSPTGAGCVAVGVLRDEVIRLDRDRPVSVRSSPEDRSRAEEDPPPSPEPVLAACPDPEGLCYAVITASEVRFLSPVDLTVMARWSVT